MKDILFQIEIHDSTKKYIKEKIIFKHEIMPKYFTKIQAASNQFLFFSDYQFSEIVITISGPI